jgi:ribosome maturation factor RimP
VRQHLLDVLTPVVTTAGYDLEDVSVIGAGRRSVVRVVVDRDGGIDLDAVAEVSRAVSDALDADAPGGSSFAGPYVLEVSSPGVDRPLSEPRHWRRAAGRLVRTTVADEPLTGRLVEVTDQGVRIDAGGEIRAVGWEQLGAGRVQVEFGRPAAEPGEEA